MLRGIFSDIVRTTTRNEARPQIGRVWLQAPEGLRLLGVLETAHVANNQKQDIACEESTEQFDLSR